MPNDRYDAIVVGARIAGATTAALLGDAGYRVLLVDRAAFPSSTLSTHFFRGAGMIAVLDRLGLLEAVLALGAPRLIHQYSYEAGGTDPLIEPPQAPGVAGYCLSVRREPLDDLLVQRACRAPTVEFLDRTRLTDVLWEDGRVTGARLRTTTGEHTVHANVIIGADGRHSAVARAVNAPVEESTPALRALYYCYIRNFPSPDGGPPRGPEFSQIEDELAYVFPSDAGLTCIALSVNLADFAWLKQAFLERFRTRILHHQGFAARFAVAMLDGTIVGCGPEPNYVRVPIGPGWALVGDAGMHQDPWSGRGMDMASTHAVFLAEALINLWNGTLPEANALATYHQQRNSHGLEGYRQTVMLARDLRQMA